MSDKTKNEAGKTTDLLFWEQRVACSNHAAPTILIC